MKKYLLSLFICCFTVGIANAQQITLPELKSKVVEFLSNAGSFLRRDFLTPTKIDDIEFQIIIITNLKDNSKTGGLLITKKGIDDVCVGSLDIDEIDACIQCLTYIKDDLLITLPENYTEVEYSTRDSVKFGAYYVLEKNPYKNRWHIYAKTNAYTWWSHDKNFHKNLYDIIEQLQRARNLIAERVSQYHPKRIY